jgi:group I intron endonuclease
MITNQKNNKRYVGFTSKSIEDRFKEHMNGIGNARLLTAAVKKYGPDAFVVELLESNQDMDYTLSILEPKYIKDMKSHCKEGHGYNISFGGASVVLGRKHSDECRNRMSESRKGKKRPESYGKKMSQILTGRPKSEEHRRKLSQANKGKIHSEERRKLQSERLKGVKKSSNTSYLKSNRRNSYQITFPDGTHFITDCLSEFCKEHDLSQSSMSRVHSGIQNEHKGFRCKKLS